MKKDSWVLTNPQKKESAYIIQTTLGGFMLQYYSGATALMGFKGEFTTKAMDRDYFETLRGAKASLSRRLKYKTEWAKE